MLGTCGRLNNKHKMINMLTAGDLIGEFGKHSAHVFRAETHMLLKQISVLDVA